MSIATPIEKSAVGARSTEGIRQTESNKVDPPAEGTTRKCDKHTENLSLTTARKHKQTNHLP
jgi:hypothetical protein